MPTSRSNKPRVVITMGDPSGIGPEVTIKALASSKVKGLADFFVLGGGSKRLPHGKQTAEAGRLAIKNIDDALNLLKSGKGDCLVTGPVNKASVRLAGFKDFQGHTEYLAAKTGSKDFAMMFVGKSLKVTLVTRHVSLKAVPSALSTERIYKTIILTHKSLKELFGIKNPKIGVCGLNPHAGESGAFGNEEANIILPAIQKASCKIKGICGPLPPDVIFYDAVSGKFDAVVSLYHDQGLIPFKLLHFKDGVNMTLGLPFIRTSPDHGTAFDIAGKNVADPTSMIEAIRLAVRLAKR